MTDEATVVDPPTEPETSVRDLRFDRSARWWVRGNYGPVAEEITVDDVTAVAPIEGQLPDGLQGSYVRNGFNPPGRVPRHWFFGAGMVHGIDIAEGRVSYRNRYVRTPFVEHDMDVFDAVGDLRASPANTSVVRHGGRLLALEEAHLPWELDDGLGTVGAFDFDGLLDTPMTAHPKVCPRTGELLFFGYQFLRQPWLTYHRADASGRLVQSEVIELPRPVMMHDFTITEHHAVFLDLPIVFGGTGFGFDPDAGARLGVLARNGRGDEIRWFEVEPCSVFHVVNSFETGDEQIVVDVCRIPALMREGMGDMGAQGCLWRWTIDLAAGTVHEQQLDDRPVDFPRIDDRLVGLEARYAYLADLGRADRLGFGSQVHRYDLADGSVVSHDLGGEGVHTFEPVFAPAGPDAAEDDGWVVVLAHDDATDVTSLHVLDAADIGGEAVAVVPLPQRVPFGAHGNWFPADV
ncbi:MAG: carotenoid oxygenase family protein [Acidimicrobiia bacterium]|nr:carotenoid oxygenase family protein [Acidimicrobiia bacterium]